jgi:hypothetical protein
MNTNTAIAVEAMDALGAVAPIHGVTALHVVKHEPSKLTAEQANIIAGMAKRSPDQYARLRVMTAERQGIPLETFDALVMVARDKLNDAAVAASVSVAPVRDDVRRREQQAENVRIQDEACDSTPPKMSLLDMLDDCVFIGEGPQVGSLSNPRRVQSLEEFGHFTAGCVTTPPPQFPGETPRSTPTAMLWKRSPTRVTVETRTFRAGAGEICRDPDGMTALNSWRPIERSPAAADVGPFLEHVAYLFTDAVEREVFIDWLAHIEQRPGELPHYGWLHIADNTGTGRNWLASLLARVWRGYVAPNLDLHSFLESSFNGGVAGRVLAIVDEVQAGGGEGSYLQAQRLKSIVNAEYRDVNPKFGRQYREYNSCRWLVFSNHENALPLNDTDRRWRVVKHDAPPRSPEVYAKLYALLNDAEFVNAVGVYLRTRDIAKFNPGERPPMNAAKRTAINASKSMTAQSAEMIVKNWPTDVITNKDVAAVFTEDGDAQVNAAMRRAMSEAGAAQYREGHPVKVHQKPHKCWVIRNLMQWADAPPMKIAAEAMRARPADLEMLTALEVLERSSNSISF